MSAEVERACEVMHDAYERAAVGAGWETQAASRKPWADVPEANKTTMRAAVGALLEYLHPEPRVWRRGDPEPGEDVRAVLDCNGDVWQPDGDGYWRSRFDGPLRWRWLAYESPLVEVTLPQAVSQ